MLSLSYLTVDGAEPLEHIEAAAAGGFDGADVRLLAPTHIPIRRRIVGNKALVEEMRRVCARKGVSIVNVETISLRPGETLESLLPALETAAELGAKNFLTVIEDLEPSEAADRFAELCAAGKQYKLRMALEFMSFRTVRTLSDAHRLVRDSGEGNAGILVDALHLSWTGGDPSDVAKLPADLIAYVQICDAPARIPPLDEQMQFARTARLYPGKGGLPLAELLDAVPPGVPVSVEVPYKAHARRSVIERAQLAGTATRQFLADYHAKRELKEMRIQNMA